MHKTNLITSSHLPYNYKPAWVVEGRATAAASWDPWAFPAAPWASGKRPGEQAGAEAEAERQLAPKETFAPVGLQPVQHNGEPVSRFHCSYIYK